MMIDEPEKTAAQLYQEAKTADEAGDHETYVAIHRHFLDTLRPLEYARLLRNA
jgi:hypothetical protein